VGAEDNDQTGILSDPKPTRDAEADLDAAPAEDRYERPASQHYAPDAVDGALRKRVEPAARTHGGALSEEPNHGRPPLFDRSSRRMAAAVLVLLVAAVALVIVLHQELGF
jgi:hypothetical protein